MGQTLIRCAAQFADLRITAAVERPDHPALGQDAGHVARVAPLGLAVTHDVAAVQASDVLIDFSDHRSVPGHAALAQKLAKCMVIGTTGLDAAETLAVQTAAKSVPIVWSPNMSLGVNLLVELVRQAAAALGTDYDIEIVETHHRHKQDAPSGTALYLAQGAASGRGRPLEELACYGRHGLTGERPRGQIGLHAVRSGGVVGDHVVSLGSDTEVVELSHRAITRDAFAVGALRAALWVAGRPAGLYGMKNVLGL